MSTVASQYKLALTPHSEIREGCELLLGSPKYELIMFCFRQGMLLFEVRFSSVPRDTGESYLWHLVRSLMFGIFHIMFVPFACSTP